MVGDALVPLMPLSLGVRLADVRWADRHLGVIGGIVCPLAGLVCGAGTPARALRSPAWPAHPLRCCRRPVFSNFMVAEQFRQEPGKVASIVLIGNVMAVIFVPVGLALAIR